MKWVIATLVLLFAVTMVAEQQDIFKGQAKSMPSQSVVQLHGCVMALNGHYGLVDSSGVVWRLDGDSAALGRYVARDVAISATPGSRPDQLQVHEAIPIGECH